MTKKYLDGNGLGTFWENAKEYIDSKSGSSEVVNGIIEQYKASTTTIDANTFVEFVNGGDLAPGTDTQLSTVSTSYYYASAVLIDTNKVFIAHRGNDGTNNTLYGMVCTISGTTITAGTDTQLSTASDSDQYASAVLVDTNKVFIAHRGGSGYLYGMVCTISGTTITAGTDTQLSTMVNSYLYASAVLVDTNKVFIAHEYSSKLGGMVCTISGTTITAGTDTLLSTDIGAYYDASPVYIDTNKVFIAHRGNDDTLYGMVCTISGTTITAGTDIQLSPTDDSGHYASAVLIDTNKVFIAHHGAAYDLYGMVCTISGTTITAGTDTFLTTGGGAYIYAHAEYISSNTVFIAHQGTSSSGSAYGLGGLYALVCSVSGTTITPGVDTQLSNVAGSSWYPSPVRLKNNVVFLPHRGSADGIACLVALVCVIQPRIQPSTTKIEGLTKTECTTTTAGDVWVLDN